MKPGAESRILMFTQLFAWATRIGFALFPMAAVAYLYYFGDPAQRFLDHGFHEVAITVAITLSSFVSFVTWRCYRDSGEPFLLWLAHALTGFTVVYLPHGILTRASDHHMMLFLLYGPVSRIVMVACLFIGLLHFGKLPHDAERRRSLAPIWRGIAIFAVIAALTGVAAQSPLAYAVRLLSEGSTILLAGLCVAIMLRRHIASPLMNLYLLGMALFAQSSAAFLLAKPWDHLWWLAHVISAGGFFALSYGIVEAFRTTRAFSTVYSLDEMMQRLRFANAELERLAATDALTGAANRRQFMRRAAEETARAQRSGEALSILMIDIDHFKNINDRHGHAAGDAVLVEFVRRVQDVLRQPDLLGRLGGEEFAVLLPASTSEQAAGVAERIRYTTECEYFEGIPLPVTVSIGVAEFGIDGDDAEAVIIAADHCLYFAKNGGRNRVAAMPLDRSSAA